MNKYFKTLIWLLAFAALGVGIFFLFQLITVRQEAETQTDAAEVQTPLVRVAVVKRRTMEQIQAITGTIEPDAAVMVVPEVNGQLEEFRLPDGTPIEEGVVVEKGQVIARIESDKLEAALDEAQANLAVAKSNVKLAEVRLDDARREKRRITALFDEGTATERQADKAHTAFAGAEAELKLSQDRVKQAEAAVQRARLTLDDATLQAPISGVVTRKLVDEGTYVTPQTPLAQIADIDQVEIRGGIPGRFFALLRPGETQARIQVDAYPETEFTGRLDRVQPQIDPATRTVMATIVVQNTGHRLKPGMFARTEVILTRQENVPVVSDAALVGTDREPAVMVISEGRVKRTPIEIGMQSAQWNEITAGVSTGAEVVVRGHHLLEDGMAVRMEPEPGE